MTKNEIKQLFVDDVEERRNKIRAYIMDETIPYEDRKEVWFETPDHLVSVGSWVIHLTDYEKKYEKISWYDDFGINRSQTVDLRYYIEFSGNTQKQDDFIKNCMKLGYHSFYNDW